MDSSASNNMIGTYSLFSFYDTKKHTLTHKVSISDGKYFSVVGSSNIKVINIGREQVGGEREEDQC